MTDTILKRMGASRKTTTRAMPIGGGKDFPTTAAARAEWLKRESAETGLDIPRLDQLLTRYGTKAREIARYRGKWTDRDRLPDSTDHSLAEIDYILQNEGVEHLSDIVMRRTTLAITGSLTLNDLQRIAATVAVMRCWDETRVSAEIDAVTTQLAKRNHMRVK